MLAPSTRADEAGPERPRPNSPVRRILRAWVTAHWDWTILIGIVGGYALLLTYLSNLRADNFYTSAWDLGINQQLLWTTAHGRVLYETADLEFYGAHSFLQVHSTYIAFLVSPLYDASPNPLTLFAVQSAVFAGSGIPLYYLARGELQRRGLALALVVLYLASFPVLAGLLYDFHWEAFIPLEILTFFLLVHRRRYALSLVPLALGTITLEVFPFLAGAVAVLVLVERGQALGFRWRPLLHDRTTRVMAGLLAAALVAYLVVRLVQIVLIPPLLGVSSVTGGGPGGLAAVVGFGANSVTLPHSLAYWLLILATLGFLPLLSPRHLILSVPWFFYSVLVSPWFSAHFGGAPALIAFPALAVAAVFGLQELERKDWTDPHSFLFVATIVTGSAFLMGVALFPGESVRFLTYSAGLVFWIPAGLLVLASVLLVLAQRTRRGGRPRPHRILSHRLRRFGVPTAILTLIVTILVLDTALSPFNPSNFGATPIPGYEFQFGENPTAAQMPWVTSYLPPNAQVLASNRLFPYVANDPNAWPIPWFVISPTNPVPNFPFSPSQLPEFVFLDAQEFTLVPIFLQNDVFNSSLYGLVAYVYATWSPGTVYLFERGYEGLPAVRDLAVAQTLYEYTYANLTVGTAGTVVSDPSSSFGRVIASVPTGPVNGSTSPVWLGPYQTFLPGNYTVTFSVKGSTNNSTGTSNPIAYLDATWTGSQNVSSFFQVPVNASQLSITRWTLLSFPLDLAHPYPMVEFRGLLALKDGRSFGLISLNSITLKSLSF